VDHASACKARAKFLAIWPRSIPLLHHHQGRSAQARSLLQSVYDHFSEGFGTADLKTAMAYLNSLQ
jgi:hypothetical protein